MFLTPSSRTRLTRYGDLSRRSREQWRVIAGRHHLVPNWVKRVYWSWHCRAYQPWEINGRPPLTPLDKRPAIELAVLISACSGYLSAMHHSCGFLATPHDPTATGTSMPALQCRRKLKLLGDDVSRSRVSSALLDNGGVARIVHAMPVGGAKLPV